MSSHGKGGGVIDFPTVLRIETIARCRAAAIEGAAYVNGGRSVCAGLVVCDVNELQARLVDGLGTEHGSLG